MEKIKVFRNRVKRVTCQKSVQTLIVPAVEREMKKKRYQPERYGDTSPDS